MAIIVVEPWKRRRLAQTFERKIEELSNENEARLDASMRSISQQISEQVRLLDALKEESTRRIETVSELEVSPEIHETVPNVGLRSWGVSQRQLEMAAVGAGAFAVGILSNLVLGR